ncbi:hypothetical protein B4102_2976 [Heyndrickxia sporothermodurans]|uniref:Uncharacterized protein n=1 Tax=Heyndrickxia sporothermodurans TaxID=46224 RepID=A0A150L521_9BACI|nr:hypothetical protein B4102_2976 [Heyndrickxia sporothermodurans]
MNSVISVLKNILIKKTRIVPLEQCDFSTEKYINKKNRA